MLQLILIVTALCILFYYYAIKPISYWKNRGVKQGKPVWLFGDNMGLLFKTKSPPDLLTDMYNAVPGVRYSGIYQFTSPALLIKDLDLIKQIGVKDFGNFMNHKTLVCEDVDPIWGKNLLFSKGKKWKNLRSLVSPSFTSKKLRSIFVLMSECAENFSDYFLKTKQDTTEIEVKEIFKRFAIDIIATTAFGVKTNSLEEQDNEFYTMGLDISSVSGFWKLLRFGGHVFFPRILKFFKIGLTEKYTKNFFFDIVINSIKSREEDGNVRPDMIQLLLEGRKRIQQKEQEVIDTRIAVVQESDTGKGVSEELTNIDIVGQATFFFVAGFETVSTLMGFVCYELALHPDIQSRLRQEIEDTLEECNGTVTYEALLKIKYLDMVISESLRKWPSVVAADRCCTIPYTIPPATPEEKALHLDVGSVILIPIYAIHRDPKYYPDPDRFDPERFSDENKGKMVPFSYLPFGVGPRRCIASRFALLETKIVLFHLLSKYELLPNTRTPIPIKFSKVNLTLVAEKNMWLDLKRLKK